MCTFESLQSVIAYVETIRAVNGIGDLGRQQQPEISSQAYHGGEIALLVECQLAKTEFGFGAWRELRHPHILRAVQEYIGGEPAET